MITNAVKRGDIVYYVFRSFKKNGSVQTGHRQAVVVQHDETNESSIVIAPITHRLRKTEMYSHVYLGEQFGLARTSMLLLEQVRTVNVEDLGEKIGHIDDEEILDCIDQGLEKVLALREEKKATLPKKRRKRKKKKKFVIDPRDIMCLCPVCRNSYRHRGFRVLNAGGTKDICDLCNYRTGVDYAVVGLLSR